MRRDLGDYDRATSELRESVRAGKAETEAALELSRILYDQGKYGQAASFAAISLQGPRGLDQADGYVLGARAMAAQGQIERARAAIKNLEDRGYPAIAARERAMLASRTEGPAAAVESVREAELDLADPANLEVLLQLVDNLTQIDRADEATDLMRGECPFGQRLGSGAGGHRLGLLGRSFYIATHVTPKQDARP